MNERQRRGGRPDDYRESHERQYGRDEPWREEQRDRYPDERYGGERWGRQFEGERGGRDSGGRGEGARGPWRGEGSRPYRGDFSPEHEEPRAFGHGYGYGFGDSGEYRHDRPSPRSWENYPRAEDQGWRGDSRMRSESSGGAGRNRASGGYGSEAASWAAGVGATFGFGPGEEPRRRDWDRADGSSYGQGDLNTDRGFEDSDWAPNRPARGPAAWAGDWSNSQSGGGYGESGRYGQGAEWSGGRTGRSPGRPYGHEDYSGRSPKDYRRSDDRIREDVCDRFTDDPQLDPSDVNIRVENCEVTLTGTVATREQKRRAEEVAERVSGVREVINQLRINRGEFSSPSAASTPAPQPSSRAARGGAGNQQAGVAADRERRGENRED